MTLHISEKAKRAGELLLAIKAISCDLAKPVPVAFDRRKLMSFVDERREILWLMAEAVRTEPFDVIAGGETAGLPFGAWLAELVGLPFVTVGQRIEGELKAGEKVLLVEDTAAGAKDVLRRAGAICEHAVAVFHDGLSPLAPDAGFTLHAMTTWRHVIDAAETFKYFPPEQIKGIRAFLENPEAWSKAHGGI